MKLMIRPAKRNILLNTKQKSYSGPIIQIFLNLTALYIANEITVDVWRSLTGH